jgi:DNA-binding response OmpR family regulator
MPNARGTILVVEDEPAIRDLLRLHLGLARFDVREEANGRRALATARGERFDLIILDVMLPGLDGVTLCQALRLEGASSDAPILMLTARDAESDKVVGLESGADDYVAKPFGIRELLARVDALLRRQKRAAGESASPRAAHITAGDLVIDVEKRHVAIRGEAVNLTRQEFDVLVLLAARPAMVFSRAALLQQVWRGDAYVTDRTVDTVVSRLRRKIESDPQNPTFILTAWGVGYKFADAS